VPVAVATYLINEKREWLRTLEDKSSAELIIVPNENIQTPEYSIRRVRDDEMELPENKQATYLMPVAPEMIEPGLAQDKKPPAEAPAVATLLPATPAPIAAPPPIAVAARERAPEAQPQVQEGFWSRFKRMLAGEPAAPSEARPATPAAAPAGSTRRDDGHRRDGRRDHSRHGRHADSARRDRSDGRRSEGRDRDRDRDRGRSRDGRETRDRDRDRDRSPESRPSTERIPAEQPAPGAQPAPTGEMRADRGERGERRGRRGRRRGRRGGGGGGAREGLAAAPSQAPAQAAPGAQAGPPTNGSHENAGAGAGSLSAAPAPQVEPVREYHSEPRDTTGTHEAAPLAHFEPAPKPDAGSGPAKPYVVWSSAPAPAPVKDVGEVLGPEE